MLQRIKRETTLTSSGKSILLNGLDQIIRRFDRGWGCGPIVLVLVSFMHMIAIVVRFGNIDA